MIYSGLGRLDLLSLCRDSAAMTRMAMALRLVLVVVPVPLALAYLVHAPAL